MKMSDGERLITVMLAEVMEYLKLDQEIDPAFVKKMVIGNEAWALKWRYHGLFSGEEPASDALVNETSKLLSMWSWIEHSVRELPPSDQAELAAKYRTQFSGFDGNNEDHHGVAFTLVKDLGRFDEFADRELNSHGMRVPKYRQMKVVFDRATDNGYEPLSKEALIEIFEA
jgi:uncharacterized protein